MYIRTYVHIHVCILAISLTIYHSYYTYNILVLKECLCGNSSGKLCFFNVTDMSVAIAENTPGGVIKFTTPERASMEFGILLAEIVKVLEEDEPTNLLLLQSISSTLTIQNNSEVHIFNHKQLEEIQACNRIRTLLTINLRCCYRWDDFKMLIWLMSSLNSEKCVNLLKSFETKVDSKMKLKQIDEYCKKKKLCFSEEYHKMSAIVNNKNFDKISNEEYLELKYFISEQCGVEDYVISPLCNASPSSLILEWYIPLTAVTHMIDIAFKNRNMFMKKSIVYVKISSVVVLDCRDSVSDIINTYSYCNNKKLNL